MLCLSDAFKRALVQGFAGVESVETLDDLLAVLDAAEPGQSVEVALEGPGGARTVELPVLRGEPPG